MPVTLLRPREKAEDKETALDKLLKGAQLAQGILGTVSGVQSVINAPEQQRLAREKAERDAQAAQLAQQKTQADIAKTQKETSLLGQEKPEDAMSRRLKNLQAQKLEKEIAGIGGPDVESENKLRKEYLSNPMTKRTQEISEAYGRIEAAADEPSAAGDLALVFNYMKVLDPGSVVRESEFATAQNAAGVPERVRNIYNRALTGERLGDDQRKDFVNRAKKLFSSQLSRQEKFDSEFANLSDRLGLRKENILLKFGQGTQKDLNKTPLADLLANKGSGSTGANQSSQINPDLLNKSEDELQQMLLESRARKAARR